MASFWLRYWLAVVWLALVRFAVVHLVVARWAVVQDGSCPSWKLSCWQLSSSQIVLIPSLANILFKIFKLRVSLKHRLKNKSHLEK